MGIYIEGMEVPKDGMLEFVITDKGAVILTSRSIRVGGNEYFEPLLTPQELYRAVPVPPHGRLGDLDALCESKDVLDDVGWPDAFLPISTIEAAPTIIPAEPGEEEAT